MNAHDSSRPSVGTLKSFLKGSSILVLSNLCLKAINFFLLPLYTDKLTPAMLGVSDTVTTFTGFLLPILSLGLDSAYSAFYFSPEDSTRADRVFSTIAISLFVVGIIPGLGVCFSDALSTFFFGDASYAVIISISLVSIAVNLWYIPYALELRLQNRMIAFGASNVAASLLMIVLNILFVSVLRLNEMSLTLSAALVSVEQLIFLSIAVHRIPRRCHFDPSLLKEMLEFSLPLVPAVVMGWILALSDRYMLLFFQGSGAVGVYGIGFRFTTVLNVIVSAVSVAYTTFAFSSKNDKNSRHYYKCIFVSESMILLLAAFSISLFGKEIITYMASAQYIDAWKPLRDLLFAQALYAMTTVVGYGILFEKKSIFSLAAVSAGAIVNLVLNVLLIPHFGAVAAAFTSLLGYLIDFIVTYHFSQKLFPCDYGLRKVLFAGGFLYGVAILGSALAVTLKIALWLLGFICITWIFFREIKKLVNTVFSVLKKGVSEDGDGHK